MATSNDTNENVQTNVNNANNIRNAVDVTMASKNQSAMSIPNNNDFDEVNDINNAGGVIDYNDAPMVSEGQSETPISNGSTSKSASNDNDENERANANNTKNIRNAADVAIASKNPYAMAAGAAVKGLDKLTGGKSSEAMGRLTTRANKMAPGGRRIQKMSNKLSESGMSDRIGRAAAMKNGMQGGGNAASSAASKSDVGSQRLSKSRSNKFGNLWNNRKKNKNNENNQQESSDNTDRKENNQNNNSIEQSQDDKKDNGLDNFSSIKVKIEIKVFIYIACAFLIVALFFALFASIYSALGITGISMPLFNTSTYETDGFVSTYEKDSSEYKDEIKYYDKLKEVSKNYANSHGEELRINYINATLIYLYYYEASAAQNEENIPIEYAKMEKMVDKIVEMMTPSDNNKNVDYEKNGEFYNNLKNSDDIKKYYSELLKEKSIDEILSGIFDLAKNLDDIIYIDDTAITEETKVTVEEVKKDTEKNTETKTQTLTVNQYLADSIYANSSLGNSEVIKAYTIAYSTNLASQNNKLSVNSNNVKASNSLCSVSLGCSYDVDDNLVSGGSEQSTKNTYFYKGQYYYKKPLESSEITSLNNDINSVFGNVLVNSDGTYPDLDIEKLNGLGGDYKSILTNSYGNLTLKNIGENSYILDGSYGTKKVKTSVIFYDQNDYSSYNFCGKKKETIKTSGCGPTSMAIIVSTYENNSKYDPVYMTSEARKTGYCGGGITGTSPGFFKKEANTMKYKYYKASKYSKKDLNLVLQHLAQGHLVIAHMSPGHFTSGGHYMVLGGVDPETKKVYVYDPYNKVNSSYRKTGSGWYSFNDIIVKEAWNFYIIWKG